MSTHPHTHTHTHTCTSNLDGLHNLPDPVKNVDVRLLIPKLLKISRWHSRALHQLWHLSKHGRLWLCNIHKSMKLALPQPSTSYLSSLLCMSHIPSIVLFQLPLQFQVSLLPPLHNSSQAAPLLLSTYTDKLQHYFRLKYHICCSIYGILNHLTCVNYAAVIWFLSLSMCPW